MYRARSVLNNLVPFIPNAAGPERFASWLFGNARTTGLVSTRQYNSPAAAEPFLNGNSSAYVEEMYNSWLADPKSVHVSWDTFFRSSSSGALPGQAYQSPPSLGEPVRNQFPLSSLVPQLGGGLALGGGGQVSEKIIDDHLAVQAIIRSYQIRGHHIAKLDPLGINSADLDDRHPPELLYSHYSFGKQQGNTTYSQHLQIRVARMMESTYKLSTQVRVFITNTTNEWENKLVTWDKILKSMLNYRLLI